MVALLVKVLEWVALRGLTRDQMALASKVKDSPNSLAKALLDSDKTRETLVDLKMTILKPSTPMSTLSQMK
jgi:hypothetical protein